MNALPSLRKLPPKLKIHEALGAIADERITIEGIFSNEGICVSASNPHNIYTIHYLPDTNSISSNDNGSLYQGYLGYPAIAFLLKIGKLTYHPSLLHFWKALPRKDIKQQGHKNHEETLRILLGILFQHYDNLELLINECNQIFQQLETLSLQKLSPQQL